MAKIYLGLIVVRMGWTSATGVIQYVHRRLARLARFARSLEVRRDRPLRQAAQILTGRWDNDEFACEALMFLWQIYFDKLDMMEIIDGKELASWWLAVRACSRQCARFTTTFPSHAKIQRQRVDILRGNCWERSFSRGTAFASKRRQSWSWCSSPCTCLRVFV